MASKTEKNWSLDSYTVDTWASVVAEASTLAALIIANTGAGDAIVQLRLADGGTKRSTILPPAVVASNDTRVLDIRSLNITGSQALEFQCDVAGVEITASGVV